MYVKENDHVVFIGWHHNSGSGESLTNGQRECGLLLSSSMSFYCIILIQCSSVKTICCVYFHDLVTLWASYAANCGQDNPVWFSPPRNEQNSNHNTVHNLINNIFQFNLVTFTALVTYCALICARCCKKCIQYCRSTKICSYVTLVLWPNSFTIKVS
jgi:hypothetical protein